MINKVAIFLLSIFFLMGPFCNGFKGYVYGTEKFVVEIDVPPIDRSSVIVENNKIEPFDVDYESKIINRKTKN